VLTASVRIALRRSIVQHISGAAAELPLMTLDPSLEQILQKSVQGTSGGALGIEPGLAERLQGSVAEAAQKLELSGQPAVLVVSPDLRPWLSRWLRSAIKQLHVLAYSEIPDNKQIKVVATVGGNPGNQIAASA
jgi:flagellar biosynthesis protein FlhA